MTTLFRKEALENKSLRLHGTVTLKNTTRLSIIAYALLAIAAALICAALLSQYSRIEVVPGVVITTQPTAKVFASRSGVIKKILVRENEKVQVGQLLGVVSVDYVADQGARVAEDSLSALNEQKSAIRDQQKSLEMAVLQETKRLQQLAKQSDQEVINFTSQIALQKQLVASAKYLFELSDLVIGEGIVSKVEHERRRQARIQENQKLQQLEQQKSSAIAQRQQFEIQLKKSFIDHQRQMAAHEGNISLLDQQRSKLRADVDYNIISPAHGRITTIQLAQGQNADPRVPIMTIVPEPSAFKVDAYAPSRSIGFIQKGQPVRLMYDAFPYQRFGSFEGVIDEVSRAISLPSELDVPLQLKEAVYRIRIITPEQSIKAFGATYALQSGMTLRVSIILEKQTFLDKLLEPFYAMRAKS